MKLPAIVYAWWGAAVGLLVSVPIHPGPDVALWGAGSVCLVTAVILTALFLEQA